MRELEAASEWQFGVSDFLEPFPESYLFRLWNQARPIPGRIFGKGSADPWDVCYGVGFLTSPFPSGQGCSGIERVTPSAARPDLSTLCSPVPTLGAPPTSLLSIPNSSSSLLTKHRAADAEDRMAVKGTLEGWSICLSGPSERGTCSFPHVCN